MIAARDGAAIRQIASLAKARAASQGGALQAGVRICDYSETALNGLFDSIKPGVVITLASLQSPWKMSPAWRSLVSYAGFGFTLPLQAVLADRVLRSAQLRHPQAILVNGCYPDFVNRVLTQRGLTVAGGIGNVAIIASFVQSAFPGRRVQLVAHHAHVSAMISQRWSGLTPPAVFIDGARVGPKSLLDLRALAPLPPNELLNSVTAAAAIPFLEALLGRSERWMGHSPGVDGRSGGFPVTVQKGKVTVTLPSGITLEQAQVLNDKFGRADGIVVENREYRLLKTPDDIERAVGLKVANHLLTWRAEALEEQANCLERWRSNLDLLGGS